MYQDCLNDATADSKSLIVEIFRDLAEYSRTVPFVPFEALKNIDCEEVNIGLNTSLSATVFRPNCEEDFVCLIMPVQIRQ